VPANLSSSIPSGLTALSHADPLRPAETPHLLAYLATVTDPRTRAGRRHPLVAILVLAAAAVLAGARSIAAIAEWAADAPQPVRAALGARRDPRTGHWVWAVPSETTIRRNLARLDAEALAPRSAPGWPTATLPTDGHGRSRSTARRCAAPATPRAGRSTCSPRWTTPPAPSLPNDKSTARRARFPGSGHCWPTWTWPVWWSPLTRWRPTRRPPGFLVTGKQAHYLLVVKANQPTLLEGCTRLAWHRVPVLDRTRDRGHGRVELRTLKAVTVNRFGFPHAAQVIQVTRRIRQLRTRRWRTVTIYAITSLTFAQASPARLADYLRGHWAIENGLHYLRDTAFAEDGSQVRTGAGPHVMACLRNLAIGALCRSGPVNLAATLRHHARDPARPLATLGIIPDEPDITRERRSPGSELDPTHQNRRLT
jgi:hypothetical protein